MREILKKASDKAKSIYLFWVAINLSIFFFHTGLRSYEGNLVFNYDKKFYPFKSYSDYDINELLFYCLVPPLLYFSKKLWPKKNEKKEVEEKKESYEFEEES